MLIPIHSTVPTKLQISSVHFYLCIDEWNTDPVKCIQHTQRSSITVYLLKKTTTTNWQKRRTPNVPPATTNHWLHSVIKPVSQTHNNSGSLPSPSSPSLFPNASRVHFRELAGLAEHDVLMSGKLAEDKNVFAPTKCSLFFKALCG